MDYFKFLPAEITLDILARVPTEDVLECKSVCKTWNNLVSKHKLFPKMHLHHLLHPSDSSADSGKLEFLAVTADCDTNENNEYGIRKFHYFEYNDSVTPIQRITRINVAIPFRHIRFHSSCHGLICFTGYQPLGYGDRHGRVCICNPITKEYVMLPEVKTDCCVTNQYNFWINAFGYVASTTEYKVVGILVDIEFIEVHIYTLGSGKGWRNLGKFNHKLSLYNDEQGTFANGVLYLMGAETGMMLTFDLSKEKFYENFSPPPLEPYDQIWNRNQIGVLDGLLYFAVFLVVEEDIYYDIWLLRKKNDNHDMKEQEEHQSWVWSKEFRIKYSQRNIFALAKSGCILTYKGNNLDICDTKDSSSETLVEFKDYFRSVRPHKNTLVSLRGFGEVDTQIMESVEVKEIERLEQVSS